MRRLIPVLLLAAPFAGFAQSLITVAPQQCVWNAGDNLAWSAPHFDESSWQLYARWNPQPYQPHVWVRCHADLSSLRDADRPALQVTLFAAYQVFSNGQLLGTAGDLQSGRFTMNAIRNWPLSGDFTQPTTIALRITFRIASMVPVGTLPPLRILGGDEPLLRDRRDAIAFNQVRSHLVPTVCFSIIGVLGLILLGLWLNDRSRYDLLLLSLECLSMVPIYLDYFGAAAFLAYSAAAYFAVWAIGATTSNIARTLFFFALARRRVPLLFWILIGLAIVQYSVTFAVPLLSVPQALWLDALRSGPVARGSALVGILESSAPFVAFLPWKRLTLRMKPLAALCMAWGATMAAFFGVRFTGTHTRGIPDLLALWANPVSDVEAVLTLCVVVALLALLFRDQRQTARERAMLAGEMRAARAVQQVIVPEALPSVPGFRIESVYKPAGEVGGDFFQILPTPAGGVLIVIGDVSGKGMPAAMTVSLLVGTVRTLAHYTQSPGEILAAMNQRMLARSQGGFTTCLVIRVDPDGALAAANAGHLPPYLDGSEQALENGLPLGLAADTNYTESTFTLAPGSTLTLLTMALLKLATQPASFSASNEPAISVPNLPKPLPTPPNPLARKTTSRC